MLKNFLRKFKIFFAKSKKCEFNRIIEDKIFLDFF